MSPEMSALGGLRLCIYCVVWITTVGFVIGMYFAGWVAYYAALGIALTIGIIWGVYHWHYVRGRKKRNGSLLPTSVQQVGDASDTHNSPDHNTPTLTQDDGRGERVVLQLPPPVVVRYNGVSNLRPASSTFLPMYMDGKDG